MSARRKTVQVAALVDMVNSRITKATTPEARAALCHLLEEVLLDTGNYKRFQWVAVHGDPEYPEGQALPRSVATYISPGDPRFYNRAYY